MHRAIRYLIVAIAGFCGAQSLSAQNPGDLVPPPPIRPDLWVMLQDSLWVCRVVGTGDTLDGSTISCAYTFDMIYGTSSRVSYTFTECKLNDERLVLKKWSDGRRVNARNVLLSFNSGTEPFVCSAGDLIQFYRELSWREPGTGWSDTNSYVAFDTLEYAIELVRRSDSQRVALLDSLGILPSLYPDRPVIYGHHPLLSMVTYTVPPHLDGEEVFIRILLHHRGGGEHWCTRTDHTTLVQSWSPTFPRNQKFLDLFMPGNGKYPVEELREREQVEEEKVEVISSVGGNREILIRLPEVVPDTRTTIGIYDVLGNAVFFPYMSAEQLAEGVGIRYRFERSGTYFVVLIRDGRVVATTSVQVTL